MIGRVGYWLACLCCAAAVLWAGGMSAGRARAAGAASAAVAIAITAVLMILRDMAVLLCEVDWTGRGPGVPAWWPAPQGR